MPLYQLRTSLYIVLLSMLIVSPAIATTADVVRSADPDGSSIQTTGGEPDYAVADLNREYFIGYWTDTKNILTSPVRWDSSDWIEASLVVGAAIGLYTQDEKIQTWVQENRNPSRSRVVDDVKRAGTLGIAALGGLGVYGFTVKDEKAKSTFLLSTESFLLTGAFVQTLKHITGRHRPYTGDPPDTFSGPGWSSQGGRDSFPSGDASSAFAIASVVASEYDNIVVPPLVYTLSTLIALGRVYNNAHWSSDIFVGSAIGYYTGKAIVASHRNNAKIISLSPILDGRTTGVLLNYGF